MSESEVRTQYMASLAPSWPVVISFQMVEAIAPQDFVEAVMGAGFRVFSVELADPPFVEDPQMTPTFMVAWSMSRSAAVCIDPYTRRFTTLPQTVDRLNNYLFYVWPKDQ